jgi:voltage-dependent calcium channel L type alpha-1D
VIKLARGWTKLQDILFKTIKSIKDISNFAVLLSLFMYVYALIGMEMFANKVRYTLDDEVVPDVVAATTAGEIMITPRMNFDNIGNSLTTIFCEIMGEDWNVYMYTFVRPQEGYMIYVTMAYFLSLMIMGNIMLLSLFTAILLQNFEDNEEEEDSDKQKYNLKSLFTRAYLISAKDGFLGVFGAKKRKQNPEGKSTP